MWVAGLCSGWAYYFMSYFLRLCLIRAMLIAGFSHLCLLQLLATHQVARMVWRPPMGESVSYREAAWSTTQLVPGCVEVVTSDCVKSGVCYGVI